MMSGKSGVADEALTDSAKKATIGSAIAIKKRGKRKQKVKRKAVVKLQKRSKVDDNNDEGNFEVREVKEVRYRGNLESNLWARRVCKERRTRLQDYVETLKGYESIEPEMYRIGRSYDKVLSTLTTPMKISSYLDSSVDDSDADSNYEYKVLVGSPTVETLEMV